MFDYRAQLVRVIDGDTIVVTCDQGLHGRQEEPLRLKGIDAPDPPELGVIETTQFVSAWLESLTLLTLRWPLYIITTPNNREEPDEKRSFIRYEAMVYNIRHYKPLTQMDPELSLNYAVKIFLEKHPEYGKQG